MSRAAEESSLAMGKAREKVEKVKAKERLAKAAIQAANHLVNHRVKKRRQQIPHNFLPRACQSQVKKRQVKKRQAPFFDAQTRWAEGFYALVCASKKWQFGSIYSYREIPNASECSSSLSSEIQCALVL